MPRSGMNGEVWRGLEGVTLIRGDFLAVNIPENSVDLIVTSPPYGVGIEYGSFNDNMPYEEYLRWTREWLAKAYAVSRPDGRLCLNIPLDKSRGVCERLCRHCDNSQGSRLAVSHHDCLERRQCFPSDSVG